MDAIILAGGMGTRLREVVPDIPKPLALINGYPFLDFLFAQLHACKGIKRVILAIGYKASLIIAHYEKTPPPLPFLYSFETSPLGTGGALSKALEFVQSEEVLVLNGDSYLEFPWPQMLEFHHEKRASLTIACREVEEVDRYGQVVLAPATHEIKGFIEKGQKSGKGWINGGVYLINREVASSLPSGSAFSFETEGIPSLLKKRVFGYPCRGKFIDIGTKESYIEAQNILRSVSCRVS